MKKILLSLLFVSPSVYAEKVDWKVCEKELSEFCTTATSDKEKHECLEEAPKGKVSKSCSDFNLKQEPKGKDKHGHRH